MRIAPVLYWHAHICKHTQSKRLNFVLLNYRSRWKLLEGSSLSFLRISALLYKAMQMRSGLRDLSAIPVARIKWEHDTVFLGVQVRRKRDESCWWGLSRRWRLNSAAYWQCLSDTNYIWLPLPTGLVSVTRVFPDTQTEASFQPSLRSLIRGSKDFCPDP